MNHKEEDLPLEYRRYAAQTGFSLPPIKKSPVEKDEKEESPPPTPAKDAPKMTPVQLLKQLENKINDTPLSRDNIQEYMKLMNDFIKLGYEMGEYELILKSMRSYLGKRPRDNGIRHSMAMTLIKLGNRKRAKVELRKILDYNPQFKQARDTLDRMRKGEL